MSSAMKPQKSLDSSGSSFVPDPWDTPLETNVRPRPRRIPLDPSHELTGMPDRQAITPEGIPAALQLPEHTGSSRSAMAILIENELKLAHQIDEHLRDDVRDVIAWLAIASP